MRFFDQLIDEILYKNFYKRWIGKFGNIFPQLTAKINRFDKICDILPRMIDEILYIYQQLIGKICYFFQRPMTDWRNWHFFKRLIEEICCFFCCEWLMKFTIFINNKLTEFNFFQRPIGEICDILTHPITDTINEIRNFLAVSDCSNSMTFLHWWMSQLFSTSDWQNLICCFNLQFFATGDQQILQTYFYCCNHCCYSYIRSKLHNHIH